MRNVLNKSSIDVSASGSNELLCDSVGIVKLERIANAAEIIVQNYWKYINEDTAKEELKNAVYDYKGWREKTGSFTAFTPPISLEAANRIEELESALGKTFEQVYDNPHIDALVDRVLRDT